MKSKRAAIVAALSVLGILGVAVPASAVYGSLTCASPSYAFTQSSGARTHYHRQDFAGVSRSTSFYSEGITRKTWGNSVRVVSYWSVTATAMTTYDNGAICVR